jgi:hypothetical protein
MGVFKSSRKTKDMQNRFLRVGEIMAYSDQGKQQTRQSKTPKANITKSQKKYLDTITGLEFNFKNILPGTEGWNTYLYENKKYSRTLILHRRKIRIKKRI